MKRFFKRLGAVIGLIIITTVIVAIPAALVGVIAFLLGFLKDPVSFIIANTLTFTAVILFAGIPELKETWNEIR